MTSVFKNAYDVYNKGKEIESPALRRWAITFAVSVLVMFAASVAGIAALVEARGVMFTALLASAGFGAYSLHHTAAKAAEGILAKRVRALRDKALDDVIERLFSGGAPLRRTDETIDSTLHQRDPLKTN